MFNGKVLHASTNRKLAFLLLNAFQLFLSMRKRTLLLCKNSAKAQFTVWTLHSSVTILNIFPSALSFRGLLDIFICIYLYLYTYLQACGCVETRRWHVQSYCRRNVRNEGTPQPSTSIQTGDKYSFCFNCCTDIAQPLDIFDWMSCFCVNVN